MEELTINLHEIFIFSCYLFVVAVQDQANSAEICGGYLHLNTYFQMIRREPNIGETHSVFEAGALNSYLLEKTERRNKNGHDASNNRTQ